MIFSATARQMDLLRFIAGYQRAHGGVSPTFKECRAGLGLTGTCGSIYRLCVGLEERGLIRRLPNRARAIEVLVDVAIPLAPDGAPLFAVRIG